MLFLLQTARTSMLHPDYGARETARKIVVVVTDGESNDRDQTFQNATQLRATGATILTVAIGIKVSKARSQS